jgi:short-subunit dehydrogenase
MQKNKKEITIHRPIVWVTGASRGIGREVAKQFAFIGCKVCLSARNKKILQSVVKEITSLGGTAYSFPCDISNKNAVASTLKKIRQHVGEVDILINNAGISSFKSFLETPFKNFEKIIQTNLIGSAFMVKAVLPAMIKKKEGWIFNVISMVALKTYENSSAYTASKSGLLGFGKVIREELKEYNIKVINVIPGATATDIWHPKLREKYGFRMMKPKSVAEAILSVYQMPDDVVVDELVVRPILGDLS